MIPFTNFTKGEIAPELQARLDTNQYGAAVRKAKNFIIQRYGGLSFRPGFRFVAEVDDVTKNIRYIPFQYNMEQAYIIALEDQRARLLASGGMVAEDNLKITGITREPNAKITAANHGYAVGDRVFFSGIGGMTEMNGRSALVTLVPDDNNFKVDIDSSDYGVFTASDGITRTAPPAPPPADPEPPAQPPAQPDPPAVVSPTPTTPSSRPDGYRLPRYEGYEQEP